uniref:Guanine nucleotide-binding protein alpha-5 subunit (inferred by orthology to a C. elegans protein) n=1 Tax=Strongyloides venezuelensis TaxID=75913 RepID=A0A0K0F0M0_STRVS
MGASFCKGDKVEDEKIAIHKAIEADIKVEKQKERKRLKILLLGSGDSGKSTIAKQMRIIHSNGFNDTEALNYSFMIKQNIITSLHYFAQEISNQNIEVSSDEMELFDRFLHKHTAINDEDDEEQVKIINHFMNYKCFKKVRDSDKPFYYPDNTTYLFDNIKRILEPTYKPTPQDIVQARAATTGVHELRFEFKNFTIRLIDVGGQKTERRKWIHSFEGVAAILFVVSLSGFDQTLEEDPTINRLEDSIELFYNILSNEFLLKSNIILFMNKKDLFESKLSKVKFNDFYKNYNGNNTFDECSKYIEQLFLKDIPPKGRQIYSHFTNATDTENINLMFAAACDIILQNNLSQAGMQ